MSDASHIQQLADNLGFALAAITPARPSDHADFLRAWLAEGRHGEMDYLARHLEQRLDPAAMMPGARSVICVADRYFDALPEPAAPEHPPAAPTGPRGRIARYAWGDDYHPVIKKRLFALADALRERWPDHEFRAAVDTAPVLEREHAARAGLGWIGKHTLLIHPRLGSYLLLGEILTTLPLADQPAGPAIGDHCGTCTRCIDACPSGCITPYSVDASRCISYLTLEHRGPIDPGLHGPMGDWIAGCDVCQEVCPHNGGARVTLPEATRAAREQHPPPAPYTPRPPAPGLDLFEILTWTAQDRQAAFIRSALKRVKLDMLKRNALIAAGNHLARQPDPALRRRIAQLAEDPAEPELVRLTARQVLQRLAAQEDGDGPGA